MDKENITGWNYISEVESSNGYEDVLNELKKYNKILFKGSSIEEQAVIINNIYEIYSTKNIFPIMYYNTDGIKKEIQKCLDKDVAFEGDILNLSFNQGSSLCRFLFPNLSTIACKKYKNNSPYEKFNDSHKLKKAISFCLNHKNTKSPVVPSGIKDGLEMLGGNVATNFKAMNAKALYEKFTPIDGIIYDFSAGFGGRMLGALSSSNNYKYIGVEPNMQTHGNLLELGKHIESVTNRSQSFKIINKGSEVFNDVRLHNKVDFAFSSPPYFNLEKYSDEDTQCYIKYPELSDWFEFYVKPTIQHIWYYLKQDAYYAVNISDFNVGKTQINFVDKWISMSEEIGFTYDRQIHMKLQTRRGSGHDETNKKSKKEGIFIFKKK